MLFTPLEISGAFGISESAKTDSRGSLTRLWDVDGFLRSFELNQVSVVKNPALGTLRGLHYQEQPYSENKVVECIAGKVFDVILDLRSDSETKGKHFAIEIGPSCDFIGLFIPTGCAHGYLTRQRDSDLIYFTDKKFSSEHASGVRWNDPSLAIMWPETPLLISERDKNWPTLNL